MGTLQRRFLGQERYLGQVGSASLYCWTGWILEERSRSWTSVQMGLEAGTAEGLEWETEGPGARMNQAALVLTAFMVYKEI